MICIVCQTHGTVEVQIALLDGGFHLIVCLSGNALDLHGGGLGSRHSVGYILVYFILLEQ